MRTAIIGGFSFLTFLVCVAVASDSVAGEFESESVKTLFTKPLSKTEFYMGKCLACALLVILFSVLLAGTGALGYLMFESQKLANNLIPVFGAVIYTSLPFLSIVFAVSTITRRSSISIMIAFLLFFAQQFVYPLADIIGEWFLKLMPALAGRELLTTAAGLQLSPLQLGALQSL